LKANLHLLTGKLLTPADVFAEAQIWTPTAIRHVLRSAPPESASSVRRSAVSNEGESFQILVRSDEPVGGVRVEADDLRGPDGAGRPPCRRGGNRTPAHRIAVQVGKQSRARSAGAGPIGGGDHGPENERALR